MKLPQPFTIADCRLPIWKKSAARAASGFNRQSPIVNRQFQQGMALVITLIMLSVTLVMAIAFLALARRERGAVSTVTDTTTARLAADSALDAAQAQIMANLLNTNTLPTLNNGRYNFGLVVSTNYINANGFDPNTALGNDPVNVNYDYQDDPAHTPLTPADYIQNIANLQFLPRVPVFIVTNTQTGSNEFRFYLDLNRNGWFEDSGRINETNSAGLATGNIVPEVGDPQWIGVLARPDTTHSPNNQFVSRYAYFAVPIGNALDLNAIHNQAITRALSSSPDGYHRNQGVGSWEINLAAFLADVNTNVWSAATSPYFYGEYNGNNNSGAAFDDARSLLAYRYNNNYGSLATADNVLSNAANIFPYDNIDGYSDGSLQTNTANLIENLNQDVPARPWAGADNTNHFSNLPADLFDASKGLGGASGFTSHLINAGNGVSTYDRYTFSRMLSQIGTDSDPDDGKLNLNYSNAVVIYNNFGVATNISVIVGAETNQVAWRASDFFTAAADRMLRLYTANWFAANPSNYLLTYYGITNTYRYLNANLDYVTNDPTGFGLTNLGLNISPFANTTLKQTNQMPVFGITNIPVYIHGQFVYSPAINRVLQLALNLYDASTTNFFPSVFRPIFEHDDLGNVFIVGYTNVSYNGVPNTVGPIGADDQLSLPFDVAGVTNDGISYIPLRTNNVGVNIYGVPWIIGAKKGFPNFNKLGMQNIVQVTRKLQVKRSTIPTEANSTTFQTNQLLSFSITNNINAECWNSYSNAYKNPIRIYASDMVSMRITNDIPGAIDRYIYNYQIASNFIVTSWPGYTNNSANIAMSFTNPISGVVPFMTNSDFYFGTSPPGAIGFIPDSFYGWESNKFDFPFPKFGLLTTNRLQLYMFDTSDGVNHIIDYVHFAGPQSTLDITAAIEANNPAAEGYGTNMWSQALDADKVPYGIKSQITASEKNITQGGLANGGLYWKGNDNDKAQVNGFASFMGLTPPYGDLDQGNADVQATLQYYSSNYVVQVPYTPTATISQYTSWQVNDPLVHYLSSDLNYFGAERSGSLVTGVQVKYGQIGDVTAYPSYTAPNERYQPWGATVPTAYQTIGNNFLNISNWIYYKDSLIWNSDSWDFSTNVYPTVGWMGRVHRGTPWQTVYFKAHNVLDGTSAGTNTWTTWTGDYDLFDVANSAPLQDRMLFDLFTTRFNDNAAYGTLPVNVGAGSSDPAAGLAAWSAMFSGMVAITNIVPNRILYLNKIPTNSWTIIQPAGVNGLNSYLGNLVANINNARTNFVGADGVKGSFEHAGDILSAISLTERSPYLNFSDTNQMRYGISDEAYEWLPQQMMGLVRMENTPRYVVYSYGQALRPAPNALVTTGGSNFGLVTNYQVVAESAVRAIVSVQQQVTNSTTGPVTNYTTKVESYSVLPPN